MNSVDLERDLAKLLDGTLDSACLAKLADEVVNPKTYTPMLEHEFGRLLVLTRLVSKVLGQEIPASRLESAADGYASSSVYCTGRILPRYKRAMNLIDTCNAPGGGADALIEAADHVSQGWAGYEDSAFPDVFRRLAEITCPGFDRDELNETSYTAWLRGLRSAAANRAGDARMSFERSLRKYLRYGYFGDAMWLYTDLVLADLLLGDVSAAEVDLSAQREYLAGLTSRAGEPAESDALQIGDVRSGDYETFIELGRVNGNSLSRNDAEALLRYITASENSIKFFMSARRENFDSSTDAFSFGWKGYSASPYPAIFGNLLKKVIPQPSGPVRISPYRTASQLWVNMIFAALLPADSGRLLALVLEVRDRLNRIGFEREAAIATADSAMLRILRNEVDESRSFIATHGREIQREVPELFQAIVHALTAVRESGAGGLLGNYISARTRYVVPDFLTTIGHYDLSRIAPISAPHPLVVQLTGETLSISGIEIYDTCPDGLAGIITDLASEFTSAQHFDRNPEFMSAIALSERTGRSPGAIAQLVRRFRLRCEKLLREASDLQLSQDAVIQGRPGYRFNPQYIARIEQY